MMHNNHMGVIVVLLRSPQKVANGARCGVKRTVLVILAVLAVGAFAIDRSAMSDTAAIAPATTLDAAASDELTALGPVDLITVNYVGTVAISCIAGTQILSGSIDVNDLGSYPDGETIIGATFRPGFGWIPLIGNTIDGVVSFTWFSFLRPHCDPANSPVGSVTIEFSGGETYEATIVPDVEENIGRNLNGTQLR
jgi:hypothetical protein